MKFQKKRVEDANNLVKKLNEERRERQLKKREKDKKLHEELKKQEEEFKKQQDEQAQKKEEERKKQKEEIMKRIHDQQEQRIKFRDETMKQVKEVLHKKPLYKQYEEKYHETVEVPLLEQKKKHLEELRNFYRPIDNSELTEHAMKYE